MSTQIGRLLRVTSRGLNLRLGAGTEYPRLRVLPQGTALTLLGSLTPDGHTWHLVRTPDGADGWVAGSHVVYDHAPWMEIARGELGTAEVAGAKHNARILEYHATTTLRATTDEVAWCSSFVNWVMHHAGLAGTRLANARSWLDWGRTVDEPRHGSVVVFPRGSDPKAGHVGFVVRTAGGRVLVLGGNQGNRVSEQWYSETGVLGYRLPALS